MDETTKGAMATVIEGMGKAAREARARRFTRKPAAPPAPVADAAAEPAGMTADELEALSQGLPAAQE